MDHAVPVSIRDNPTAEMILFLISALSGLFGLTVFAAMIWEISPLHNGYSDKLFPLSLLINFLVFPITAYTSLWLYNKCRDTFSESLHIVVITWQSISLLAWLLAAGVVVFGLFAWLSGNFMWHGQNLTPPAWSPFA